MTRKAIGSVFEFGRLPSDVVGCFAECATLDLLQADALVPIRIAPTELLRLGERDRIAAIEAKLIAHDPNGVAVDLSPAYSMWVMRGDDRVEAFIRLSQIPITCAPLTIQGLVAQVPGKVVVRPGELVVCVSSVVSHHLRKRLVNACFDLHPTELAEPASDQKALV